MTSPTACFEQRSDRGEDNLSIVQLGAEWVTENVGGANRYSDGLARALAAQGVDQRWLVMGRDIIPATSNLRVTPVAPPEAGLRSRWHAMRKAWPEHAAGSQLATSHFALYAFPLRDQLRRLPHVVHFHGPWADESRAEGANPIEVWVKRRLERAVYRTGDLCITLSAAFANVLSQQYGVDPDRIRVIPGGVDSKRFAPRFDVREARERFGWPIDRPTVLCVRRLVRRVGLEQLLEAMVSVHNRLPEALLCIAGKGPLQQQLQQQIDRLGLNDAVHLLGFVPDDELPAAYRAADLSIVPSQTLEGFGLVIPESLAAGTPALVTPVGGMPDAVLELSPDLVLPDRTPGAIAEGIFQLLRSPSTLPDADGCHSYAAERFDWAVIAEQVLRVYREAIASRA